MEKKEGGEDVLEKKEQGLSSSSQSRNAHRPPLEGWVEDGVGLTMQCARATSRWRRQLLGPSGTLGFPLPSKVSGSIALMGVLMLLSFLSESSVLSSP